MGERENAPMASWLIAPMNDEVSIAIERLRRAPDVRRVAVMPDVHLAQDVCVGVAVATRDLLYPQAVGGDIGCGVLAVGFDVPAEAIAGPRVAGELLARLGSAIPARRRNRRGANALPADLDGDCCSDPRLEALWRKLKPIEYATIGSGNHFVELQADEQGRLWLMVHSGSRGLGPAIRDHHLARAEPAGGGLRYLDSREEPGRAYLADARLAQRFAAQNRRQIAILAEQAVVSTIGSGCLQWDEAILTDHNHVEKERHGSEDWWVHRKGAMPARAGQLGALPGSMGTLSYHVMGRGCTEALCSSAHGAGRILSRTQARNAISSGELRQQMGSVWFDVRQTEQLRDEAPGAYKDIRAVARAQSAMTKVTRVLRPVLNYKGT